MNLSKTFIILLALLSISVSASSQDEINHLLSYVGATSCQYERNGTMHTGAEALKHINKKYRYYTDDITSAEDFIAYSATKSTMSGKYYKIHCDSHATVKSQDWLLQALKVYRASQKN